MKAPEDLALAQDLARSGPASARALMERWGLDHEGVYLRLVRMEAQAMARPVIGGHEQCPKHTVWEGMVNV